MLHPKQYTTRFRKAAKKIFILVVGQQYKNGQDFLVNLYDYKKFHLGSNKIYTHVGRKTKKSTLHCTYFET